MTGKGNAQSIFLAYQETNGFLRRYLRRFYDNRQDIEDAMQEGFLKSFEIEKKQKIASPAAYLFMTVRNFACRDLKKKSRLKVVPVENIDLPNLIFDRNTLENSLELRQSLSLFCDAADQLPDQCRKAFLLRKVYGCSQKEIAVMMKISISTVEKHLAKGLRRTMDHMAQNGEGMSFQLSRPRNKDSARTVAS